MMKAKLKIEGMSCEHCVATITKAVESAPGVEKVKINLKKKEAKVKFDDAQIDTSKIINVIKEAGFEAEVI